MMKSDEGVKTYAKDRLSNMILGLHAYSVSIPEDQMDKAINLLKDVIEAENRVITSIPITNQEFWNNLPKHQQDDASWLIRELYLSSDTEYLRVQKKWSDLLKSFRGKDK